jgi:hypothetical protein
MIKLTSKLALALFCAIFLASISDAQAQKKPKLKGLAKEIIGEWILDDLDVKLDEGKADSVAKVQFSMMQMMMGAMKQEMKGKVGFTFKADGTYTRKAQRNGENNEGKGTWTLEGNKLKLKAEVEEGNMPEFLLVSIVDKKLHMEAPPQKNSPIPVYTLMKLLKKS